MKSSTPISPQDTSAIALIMAEAVAEAVEIHRRLKQPVVVIRDNQITWLSPEQMTPRSLPGDEEALSQACKDAAST